MASEKNSVMKFFQKVMKSAEFTGEVQLLLNVDASVNQSMTLAKKISNLIKPGPVISFLAKGQHHNKSTICTNYTTRRIKKVMTAENCKNVFRKADAICFDVDSTVLKDEALDELAKFCGVGEQVVEWTNKAMGGSVSFREALTERLKIVQPTKQNVTDYMSQHPPQFTPGIKEVVSLLQKRGVPVYLVSGGFQSILVPVAEQLNIPVGNIIANRLKFYFNGEYAGFDEDQPTSSSGGKQVVVQRLKNRHGYKNLVMIGDGATDMEACPPADAFIGFGGNIVREKVKQNAPWFVTDMQELIDELKCGS